MSVEQVASGVFRVMLPIPFELREVNVYLVDTGSGFLLIDTGVATDEGLSAMTAGLAEAGIGVRDITTILVTHFHADHAGQAARLAKLADAPIVMSRSDAVYVRDFFAAGPPIEPESFYAAHGAPTSFGALARDMLPALGQLMIPFVADQVIDTGEAIVPARNVVGLLTPGHTPGHMTALLPDEGFLFAGDHVLPRITPNIGLYEATAPNPLGSFLESLVRVRDVGAKRIFPAHGPVIDEPDARIGELIEHHQRRLDHMAALTAGAGSTAWDISSQVFGTALAPMHAWLAFFESLAHLEYLVEQGVLRREAEPDRVIYAP